MEMKGDNRMESVYLEEARRLRAITEKHYNCAQSVLVPFAGKCGISEEQAYKTAANFGAGMKIGSVCGAVTGALMALGLLGIDDPASVGAFFRSIRERHEGCIDCADLLRINKRDGGEKKPHCDAMVYECVQLVEEMMRGKEE